MALRFGLIPSTASAGRAFASRLGDVVGEPVEVHESSDYRSLVAALSNGLVQLAWVPPVPAARAIRDGAIRPLVITRRNGTTSYSSCLFALRSRGFGAVETLRDLKAGWVDRESASGYVVIRAALRNRGVSLVRAFAYESFERSHKAVAEALKDGRIDVAATYVSYETGSHQIARAGWREAGLLDDEVQILAEAGPIAADLLAIHSSASRHATALINALTQGWPAGLHEAARALTDADGFVVPTPEHIAMLQGLLASMEGLGRR